MAMTLFEIQAWSAALKRILDAEQGSGAASTEHRARVEAEMRRLHQ